MAGGTRGIEYLVEEQRGRVRIGLEERGGGDQEGRIPQALAHLWPAVNPETLVAHHVRPRAIVHVDEQAIRAIGRREQRTKGRAQRLVVARDDQHDDRFTIVTGCADDEVPQHISWTRAGGPESRPGEKVPERERERVRAGAVHRTRLDRHDRLRARRKVTHNEAGAPAWGRAEDERSFVAEVPGRPVSVRRRREQRENRRRRASQRAAEQTLQLPPFRQQLFGVGHILRLTPAARSEVRADHRHSARGARQTLPRDGLPTTNYQLTNYQLTLPPPG